MSPADSFFFDAGIELIAFDLDDTLAPSKSPIHPDMGSLLERLLASVPLSVISGGQFAQFESQLIDGLPPSIGPLLPRLHLLPTCGTQYYRYDTEWRVVYVENLTASERAQCFHVLEAAARLHGFWSKDSWGPVLEDRGSQITFSALGQGAPIELKRAWDPDGRKRELLRETVARLLPELEVRSGGSTSIDITRKGIDKSYGIRKLAELTGISTSRMLFIGDRLDEGGNDFPVKATGVRTHAVGDWEETAAFITALLLRAGVASTPTNTRKM